MHREGEIGGVIVRDVLHDHVHLNVSGTDRTENLEGHTRDIGHATDSQLGLIAIKSDA